ncbi:MAG: response regulator [Thermodesulfovibrionales bacterium]
MKKILVIDDDDGVRTTLSDLLRCKGYYTCEASSGKDAVEMVKSEDFDIVLLDLMMPGMDGLSTLRELRRLSPKARVIMITAFATVENAVDVIKKGASDYISKPFKTNELLVTIKRVLEEVRFEEGIKKLDLDYALDTLSNSVRRKIMELFCSKTNMRLTEITKKLNIDDHTKILFHLKALKEKGIIEQDKEKSYSLTEEGEKTLNCLKALKNYLST